MRNTKTEESMKPFEGEPDQLLLSRKWSCPGPQTVAAYADCALSGYRRVWVQFHLSRCQRCRTLVGDAVKSQRDPHLPMPPIHLIQTAMATAEKRTAIGQWAWVPVGAVAGMALLAVFIFLRTPQQLVIVPPSIPAAPVVAKSDPLPAVHSQLPDLYRKRNTPELLPTLLTPQPDSAVDSDRVQFRWKAVPRTRNYEVRVVRSDGDLVWKGQTENSVLQLPAEVGIRHGSYFAWVTAYTQDGRTVRSAPVRFLVAR